MKTYLVTGAAGFIGCHLARHLAKQGHRVIAADIGLHATFASNWQALGALPEIELLNVDLTDASSVEALPAVDGVYHMAALNGTQNFYTHPWRTVRHTTIPTLLLLDRYTRDVPDFFFYAGSSEAYASTVTLFDWPVPTSEAVPLSISDPTKVRWSYGASKMHGEIACFAAQAETGLPIVVGRFHNAYGPDMGVHHVIPDFIERGKRGVFELYGAEHTRSFIYIDDAVKAVTTLAAEARGQVVNIGSPVEVTMRELARTIMDVAGWSGKVVEFDGPEGSVLRRAPEVTLLRALVDVDAFVPLDEGVRRTLVSYLG
jgi:nucleoside-diphosphate-sugar epimerase